MVPSVLDFEITPMLNSVTLALYTIIPDKAPAKPNMTTATKKPNFLVVVADGFNGGDELFGRSLFIRTVNLRPRVIILGRSPSSLSPSVSRDSTGALLQDVA